MFHPKPEIEKAILFYFKKGHNIKETLKSILKRNGKELSEINSFFDFASGHGRVTRFLVQSINPKNITISDIDKEANRFNKKTFKTKSIDSDFNPKKLITNEKYEVIFSCSLFSHLSIKIWALWLAKLYSLLEKDGLLIFTTRGFGIKDKEKFEDKKIRTGFSYLNRNKSNGKLNPEFYGCTTVSPDFVKRTLRSINKQIRFKYYPNGLNGRQDIYVIKKSSHKKQFFFSKLFS